ncbi:MAG: phosphate ABC transporter ATP-binding protein [Deltaproteobacteria bacterium RIFOXYA12_FULL_58_15]|nr:MAG: phosphate ABC transporter ATP-binding protein [Deltaproteobacteria bacterium RIFOXYA12_FULL_58_15]
MEAITARGLNVYYGGFHAIKDVTVSVAPRRITSLIGPSGCGKSTLLRTFNRMNDLIAGVRVTGDVEIFGRPLYGEDVHSLRRRVGMVFQRPNPFPLSVYDNVAHGPRVHGTTNGKELDEIVARSLSAVGLWETLKDRLREIALSLSGEQQQRLCFARLLAVQPEVLLMDEPCSALDPISTTRVEELMQELKKDYTIVIVTHNMQQAARVSEDCGFMLLGELVEFGRTDSIFTKPSDRRTEDYITGRYG